MTCSACVSGQSFCDAPNCPECNAARLRFEASTERSHRYLKGRSNCELPNVPGGGGGFKVPGFSKPRQPLIPGGPGIPLPLEPLQPGDRRGSSIPLPLEPLQPGGPGGPGGPGIPLPFEPVQPGPTLKPAFQPLPVQPSQPAPMLKPAFQPLPVQPSQPAPMLKPAFQPLPVQPSQPTPMFTPINRGQPVQSSQPGPVLTPVNQLQPVTGSGPQATPVNQGLPVMVNPPSNNTAPPLVLSHATTTSGPGQGGLGATNISIPRPTGQVGSIGMGIVRYAGVTPEAAFLRWQFNPIAADFYAMGEREQYALVLRYLQSAATEKQRSNALFGTMQPPPFKTGLQLSEATRQYVRLMNSPGVALTAERQNAVALITSLHARGHAVSYPQLAAMSVGEKVKALLAMYPRANDSELARLVGGIDRYLDVYLAAINQMPSQPGQPGPAASGQVNQAPADLPASFGVPGVFAPSGQTQLTQAQLQQQAVLMQQQRDSGQAGGKAGAGGNAGGLPPGALDAAASALSTIGSTINAILANGNAQQVAQLQSQAAVEIARINANASTTQNAQQQADMQRRLDALTALMTATQAAQQQPAPQQPAPQQPVQQTQLQPLVFTPPAVASHKGLYIGLAVGGVVVIGGGVAWYMMSQKKKTARPNPDPWALAPYQSPESSEY